MFIVKYFKYCLGLFDKTYLLSRYIKFVKNSFVRFEVSLIYFYLENISVSSISIQYTQRGRYARGIQLNHIDSSFNSVHAIFSTATLMTRQIRTHIHAHIHTYTHTHMCRQTWLNVFIMPFHILNIFWYMYVVHMTGLKGLIQQSGTLAEPIFPTLTKLQIGRRRRMEAFSYALISDTREKFPFSYFLMKNITDKFVKVPFRALLLNSDILSHKIFFMMSFLSM